MTAITAPASARDALDMIHVALDALAATDPGQLDPATLELILREVFRLVSCTGDADPA